MSQIVGRLWLRTGVRSSDKAQIRRISELENASGYQEGTVDALMFIKYYHNLSMEVGVNLQSLKQHADERFRAFASDPVHARQIDKSRYIRRALVRSFLWPKLKAVSP